MLSSQSEKKTKKSSKMLRRRERGEVLEAPEIPSDLLIQILKKLPPKSLARFKCVSKLWSSLIHSQGYLFASPPRLFISLYEGTRHNPVKSVLISLTSTISTAFDFDTKKQGTGGHCMVVLRGLILYDISGQACIYNPTTAQRVTLPAIDSNILAEEEKEIHKFDVYMFGYDPVLEQYKVVCSVVVVRPERLQRRRTSYGHWVFLLEAGSSWKRIEGDHPHLPQSQGLCINGVIYYLASSYPDVVQFMSFDVRSEEFSMIQLPENAESVGLIEYGGKPTLFDYANLNDSLVKLWILEDTGKWSLVLQSCRLHFFLDTIYFDVIGTTQNGEVVLKPLMMSYPYYILYYDLHKKDLKKVDIRGMSDYQMDPKKPKKSVCYLALMDTGESIMHLKI